MATIQQQQAQLNDSKIDEDFYSRQLYVIDKQSMYQMMNSNVLICGMCGLGVEIAKNIILCGVKSVIIQDSYNISYADLSSQYYFSEIDIGENRAKIACSRLSELNNTVHVTSSSELLSESFIQLCKPDIVVLTNAIYDEQIVMSDFCHKHSIKLLIANTKGLFGQLFCDFGEIFEVLDSDGEKPQEHIVVNISHDTEGLVSILHGERHGFEDGSYVTFSKVNGMEELNGKEFKIRVLDPFKFRIGDTAAFGHYDCGGKVKEVKKSKFINFKSYSESLNKPSDLPIYDFGKMGMSNTLHLAFRALSEFKKIYNAEPIPWNDADAEKLLALTLELNTKIPNQPITDELNEDWIKLFSKTCTGILCPIQSIIGGIAAQEIIKAITGKFMPIHQFFYFDAIECLPRSLYESTQVLPNLNEFKSLESAIPHNVTHEVNKFSRYYSQQIIFGSDFQYKLGKANYLMVGCGAAGCELLKNFCMMGIGCEKQGGLFVVDMDVIEKSNLNRHFLFRSSNIGDMKSSVAVNVAKRMNHNINIHNFVEAVNYNTESLYNDSFFKQFDGIIGALDNKVARLYLDQRCVSYRKPWIDCGTLGTKANIQVILPFLTESYSSIEDPPEQMLPLDKIYNFPNTIQDSIIWARDNFRRLFIDLPEQASQYMLNSKGFLETVYKSYSHNYKNPMIANIKRMLGQDHPKNFLDCIKWARNEFEELFHNNILRLLYHFPRDCITNTGERFWIAHRMCPHAIQFDFNNPIHMDFIVATSNLIAHVYTILQFNNRHDIIEQVKQIQVPLFEYHPNEIENDDEDIAIKTTHNSDTCSNTIESVANTVFNLLPKQNEYHDVKIQPHHLKLDDNSNFQLDYLLAMTNLRADNYEIEIAERSEVKRIAGNINPALITTNAVVAGLASLEVYKLVQGHMTIEYFKNSSINLASPLIVCYEPVSAKKQKYFEKEFTLWDRFDVQGDTTLEDFMDYFKREHKLCPEIISVQEYIIYASFLMSQNKRLGDMKRKITEIYERMTEKKIPAHVHSLTLVMVCNDLDGNEINDIPNVHYSFR